MDENKADVFLTYCTNAVQAKAEVPNLKIVSIPASQQVAVAYNMTVKSAAQLKA
jgi:molybdate transport system substrate-binding protein